SRVKVSSDRSVARSRVPSKRTQSSPEAPVSTSASGSWATVFPSVRITTSLPGLWYPPAGRSWLTTATCARRHPRARQGRDALRRAALPLGVDDADRAARVDESPGPEAKQVITRDVGRIAADGAVVEDVQHPEAGVDDAAAAFGGVAGQGAVADRHTSSVDVDAPAGDGGVAG